MCETGTVTLTTPRLTLRRFTLDDAPAMYTSWTSDPKVTTYLSWSPHLSVQHTRALLAGWIAEYADPTVYRWGIEVASSGDLIGSIDARNADPAIDLKEIGYCLGSRWWGRGYMTEALRSVITFLLDRVGVNRVEAAHDPRNPASGRVMAKAGMRYEGTLRAAHRNNQGLGDSMIWSTLRGELLPSEPPSGGAGSDAPATVRLATPDDLHAVTELRLAFTGRFGTLDAEQRAAVAADTADHLPDRLRGGDLVVALAEVDDRPAAVAWLDLGLRFLGRTVGPIGTLFNVWTEPDHRGRGLSRQVVRACLVEARRRGVRRVDLRATAQAQPMYARLGFRPTVYPAMRLDLTD